MNSAISNINTIITLSYLKNQSENQYFERKGKDIKPTKIAEELIGMLNADGGTLVLGVHDDGTIQDLISLGDKLNDYRKLVFDFIKPPCNIHLEEIEIDGKLIFLYHVEPDLERVFSRNDNDCVYLRVHDTNRLLNRDQIKKLEYDKSIRRFEEELVKGFDREDFDETLLEEYKTKLNYQGTVFDLLVKRHLAIKKNDAYDFKNLAVLLFAKDPEKYIPSASVRYIRYEGLEALTGSSHNVVKDERFENNDTQRKIIAYLFVHSSATLDEIVAYVKINENTVRNYLNKMIEDQIAERISTKLRDKNAKYQFRKKSLSKITPVLCKVKLTHKTS